MVTRSDLDIAATTLKTSLDKAKRAALQSQVSEDEVLVNPPCQTRLTSDHHAEDDATSLQVTVTYTCRGLASPKHAIQEAVQQALAQ